jgi:hypothetical protein
MTNPTIFLREDGLFAWLPEDADVVHEALAAIHADMAGYSEEEIVAACTQYLRDLYHSRTIH